MERFGSFGRWFESFEGWFGSFGGLGWGSFETFGWCKEVGKVVMGSVMRLVVFGIWVVWMRVRVMGILLGVVMTGLKWQWGCAVGWFGPLGWFLCLWGVWALGVCKSHRGG